ncbi:uncharacterized protein TEOVI_000334800 [Trypanosoma equiperdum]|uniref:Uncharacterized protein n=1 Tax=Trypanosoma equiperdum TaxID=5694 RepID=A0A1G4IHM8_TRYEQ|nr:hypothetical protein, conserved [Trypanosoma equiperdum]
MSDVLAILDGAAARVAALLMSEGINALLAFLRGEAWEESPSTVLNRADGDGDTKSDSLQIPNTLLGCYGFLPLAIAAEVSLAPSTSHQERVALVQDFERRGFRVFTVNLMPDCRGLEDSSRGASAYNASASVLRLNCIEAARNWCDAVYAEDGEEGEGGTGVDCSNIYLSGAKRRRDDDEKSGLAGRVAHTHFHNPRRRAQGQLHGRGCGLCVKYALFIVRCCANAGNAQRAAVGGGNCSSATERSRRTKDPLTLLLYDISSLSALCRVRQSTRRTRIRFSVLLLPDDLAYGGALLEESLRGPMSCHYCVKLFQGSVDRMLHRRQDVDRGGGEENECVPFLERLKLWLSAPMESRGVEADGSCDGNSVNHGKNEQENAAKLQGSKPSLFFVRYENLPFCCFLREALRRFPVILPPLLLRQLQSLWAFRHQLSDVVVGLHSLLSPFALSSSVHATMSEANDVTTSPANVVQGTSRGYHENMTQLSNSIELLNILFAAACEWADGHLLNEAVAFAVLYEDLVFGRLTRLKRIPGLTAYVERLSPKSVGPTDLSKALTSCVPVFVPNALTGSGAYIRDELSQEQQYVMRRPLSLPPIMAVPGAKVSLATELLRSTLLAVLPPHDSLEEVQKAVRAFPCAGGKCDEGTPSEALRHGDTYCGVAYNNFFSPLIPDSVRVLHLLTSHAMASSNVKQQFVPLSLIQRICQLSDESLIRSLVELQLTGMATVNMREFKARSSLLALS